MAIKMTEPLGNPMYAPFFVRISIGGYFLLAGLMKLDRIPAFIKEVQAFDILPYHLATVYAILLPYTEVVVGSMLLLGSWTTLAAMLASSMLFSFVLALGIFPNSGGLYNKDLILLAGSLSLLFSGSGALSVDRFRKSG
jgi:uncharacterized membrane protein YphA (DoxX/SURF4 family)